MILQSNLELTAEKIYDMYISRWLIEEMFRMYKHIEEFDDTRVHSDFSVMGEKLINFVSTIITSRFMNLFLDKGLLEKQTFGEVMDTLRRSLKFQIEDGNGCSVLRRTKRRRSSGPWTSCRNFRLKGDREDLARIPDHSR